MTGCLVTGASGFLGRRLVPILAGLGHEVAVVSRTPVEGVRTFLGDLTGEFNLSGANCSQLYHLAGLAHLVPRSEREGRRFFEVNVEGTRNLLRRLDLAGEVPRSAVLVSTVSVYGLESGELLDEDTPRRATDPYGASKAAAEDLVREWGDRRGVRVGVVRLPLVVGRDAPGNFGAMVQALRGGRYFGIGSGTARRSMVLVDDAARALYEVAASGGVFHLTDGRHPSFAEIEKAIASGLGRRSPGHLPLWAGKLAARVGDLAEHVTRFRMPLNSRTLAKMTTTLTFSDQKARRALGWNPRSVVDCIPGILA